MKIGIFTDSYLPLPNGVATAVDRSVRTLEKRGHEVIIVAPSEPKYKDKRINIYRLPSVRFFETGTRFALHIPNKTMLDIIKNDFDIIHAHNGGPISLLAWEIAKTKNIPYIFTYHTLLAQYTHYFGKGIIASPTFMKFLSKLICNYSDYLIAPSTVVKEELEAYGVTQKINVLPTGIELDTYQNVEKGFIRDIIHVDIHTKILLHVGRLGKEKSIDFIIKAFSEIKKNAEDTILVLIGTGSAEHSLKTLAKKLHIEDSVYFLGAFAPEDMPKIYKDADVFVFASKTETQGLVILESLASSLPIVAVQEKVYEKILINEENSYLVPRDIHVFADKVCVLLKDTTTHNNFAKNGYLTAKNHTIEHTVGELEKIYTELIHNNKITPISYRRKYIKNVQNILKPLLAIRKT